VSSIEIFFDKIQSFEISKKFVSQLLYDILDFELKKAGDICIIFCSDDYLYEMNKKYLNHYYYTDIITFNYVEDAVISGDLFISIDRIRENAKKFRVTFLKELYRVIIHGVLHLVGYHDETTDEQRLMRGKEDFYLSKIEF
jgi:probable rRNA maturation factor